MPQGSALPTRHVQNPQQEYWLDPVDGNDTTGNGSEAQPWKTLQKADDSIVNPGTGDVVIEMADNGAYQAADNAQAACLIGAGTVPSSTHRWIFRPAPGAGRVTVKRSGGSSTVDRWCFRINTAGNVILEGMELTEDSPRPTTGSASGIWQGASSDAPNCEYFDLHIHDLNVTTNTTRAQGIDIDNAAGGDFPALIENVHVERIGLDGEPRLCHGVYISVPDVWLINVLANNMANGYGLQFFSGTPFPFHLIHCTVAGPFFKGAGGDEGPLVYVAGGDGSDIRNSIFCELDGTVASIHRTSGTGMTGSTLDHLILRKPAGTYIDTPANWATQTNIDEDIDDPGFVDLDGEDFHLLSDSVARGFSDTEWSRPYDIEGNPRPAGQEDAGAFQFVEETSPEISMIRSRQKVGR